MAFGKLYSYENNPRTIAIRAIAKANNLAIEEVETNPFKSVDTEYLKINKLGLVPSFVGEDGYVLTESIAIAIYFASQNEKTALLGKTKQDYASIVEWMSYTNQNFLTPLGAATKPLKGREPYNKKNVDDGIKATLKAVSTFEQHLLVHTYLVGERISLADIYTAGLLSSGFKTFFDKAWRSENPNTTRWYETICNQPIYSSVAPKFEMIDEAIKNVAPPKAKDDKPKQEKAPKAAAVAKPKAKAVEDDDEEEEDKPAPKPKHPLEALPKATIPLDEMKRKYSNEDTPVALKWFWDNYKPEEYSLWRCDYKYNDELTMTFMTSNLIGGFFTRLEASRKYIFGAASVFGVTNDSVVQGAFVIRGQEAEPAFDVAPDFESYKFTKLDAKNAADKKFVDSMWTWEEPVEVAGKKYEWADGKVFK